MSEKHHFGIRWKEAAKPYVSCVSSPGIAGRCGRLCHFVTQPLSCLRNSFSAVGVFGRAVFRLTPSGLERRDRHTRPYGGQRRVFLPLPLLTLSRGAKLAHRGTHGATRASSLSPAAQRGRTGGAGGSATGQAGGRRIAGRSAWPPLGAMKLAISAWLSAAQEAIFGSRWGFKYSDFSFFLYILSVC